MIIICNLKMGGLAIAYMYLIASIVSIPITTNNKAIPYPRPTPMNLPTLPANNPVGVSNGSKT
ncbi:hypothetical protein [Fischerella thermalis]|nr:hypothetical protein [Fischerella thermalis M48_A2018_028]